MEKGNLPLKLNEHIDTFSVQLIITEDCNLQCKYCFEHGKNPKYMNIDTAKKILEKELTSNSDFKKYTIDLGGGEPFLHFKFIKELIEYAKDKAKEWNKEILFFITSNVTLFNDEIKEWLVNNKDWVIIGTSLDGIKKVHDYNRSNSYDSVVKHLDFLKTNYPNQTAKMTIGRDSIPYISESFKHIEESGMLFSANVVFENAWGNRQEKIELLEIFAEQLEILVQHYSINSNLEVPSLLNLSIQRINSLENDTHWCGSGRYMRAYDTEGNSFPCHRYAYFCAKKHYVEEDLLLNQSVSKNKCLNCQFIKACPTCAAHNWEVNNNPDIRTDYHCEFIKLQLLATAMITYNRNKDLVDKINSQESIEINEEILDILPKLVAAAKIIQIIDVDSILADNEICTI